MAIDVEIRRWTGASGAPTKTPVDGTNSRILAIDEPDVAQTSNSIAVPDIGTNNSFWAVYRVHIVDPDGHTIQNVKVWTDGSETFASGITIIAAQATTYIEATGVENSSGDELSVANYATLTDEPVSFFDYVAGSELSLGGSSAAAGDLGNFLVLQYVVDDTATSGVSSAEVVHWSWDVV